MYVRISISLMSKLTGTRCVRAMMDAHLGNAYTNKHTAQHSTAQHIILMAEPILRRTQALHVQIWYTVVSFFAVERVRDGNKQN